MKAIKKAQAAFIAACLCAACLPSSGMTGSSDIKASAAVEDISSSMEWGTLTIGGGGFVSAIVTGQENMYARTDVGGAYKYNYETGEWDQLFGFLNEADRGLLSVSGIAIDPTDDDTVYFLCGCAYFSAEETVIFKTTDGGKTFSRYDVTDMILVHANGDGRECSEPIAVDPDDPNIIYAGGDVSAGSSCLIKSTDGGKTWNTVKGYDDLGLYTETINWPSWGSREVKALSSDEYNHQNGIDAIAIYGGKVYVGTAVTGKTNIHVADIKNDKFTELSSDLPTDVYPVSICPDNNGNLYFTYIGGLAFTTGSKGIFKYNTSAGTVKDVSPSGNGFGVVSVDKNDPDKLVTRTCGAWLDQWYEDEWSDTSIAWGDYFFRSEDGGDTWTNITPGKKGGNKYEGTEYTISLPMDTNGYEWIYGKACHWGSSMVIDPCDPDKVLLTSGNGVFACDNVWDEQDVQFYFDPEGIEEVVALDFVSTSDGLDLSAIGDYDGYVHLTKTDIGLQYSPNMGSTSAIAVCPQNTDVWVRIAESNESKAGTGFYTTDRGETWQSLSNNPTGGKAAITQLDKSTYRIFCSSTSGALSYTDDFGKTWTETTGINSDKTVHTTVDPGDPSIVYATGTRYNQYWFYDTTKSEPTLDECHYSFYISKDYGKTFTETQVCRYDQCDNTGDLAYVSEDTIAMAAGWYGLYIITNSGKTVTKLDSVFYAKCVGYGAPEKDGGANTLYIYGRPTENDVEGIYRSTDAGKSWVCINTDHLYGGTGNGNFLVGDMNEFGTVYMSTVGCGIVYGMLSSGDTPQPTTTTTTKNSTAVWGDANCDKSVDLSDSVLLLQSIANPGKYGVDGSSSDHITDQGLINGDVYQNGSGITAMDALSIQKFKLKLVAELPES